MRLAQIIFRSVPTDDGQKNLIKNCQIAESFLERMIGLLNHERLLEDEGLLLERCNQVHTFFMKFPIDIVVLNSSNEVVACKSLKPWRLSKLYWGGSKILELAEGQIHKLGISPGQKVEVVPCSNS